MLESVKKKVWQEVEKAWPRQLAHLQALVREPSILGNEAGVQRLMQATFREMGLEVHTFEPDIGAICALPGFSPPEWSYRGRPNVVGVWKGSRKDGRSLVLNGHVDVVSPEPISHWTYDPWGAIVVGDRLYGRGALDMKAGVNAMVWAVRAIQEADVLVRGDIVLQSVIEEECTGNGTLACLHRGFTADGCLIPEPFYRQAPVAQVGVLWGRIKVRGVSYHVMAARSGVNAIEKVWVLINAMRELEARLNSEKPPAFRDVAWPITFNPGVIRGGDWPSTVPAECELEFRMGFYPGMTPERAKTLVRDHLLEAAATDPWLREHPPEITFYGFHAEGMAFDFNESPVIRTLNASHQGVTGRPLEPVASTATTDARFFHLYYDIPVTCYGPSGGKEHGADEYVELPSVLEVTKVIATFIVDWCDVAQ